MQSCSAGLRIGHLWYTSDWMRVDRSQSLSVSENAIIYRKILARNAQICLMKANPEKYAVMHLEGSNNKEILKYNKRGY